jgi:3-hydroxyacyl-[acyl-carrier-protein] dehydratase
MLDTDAIRSILPHRYPMLLVDRVLEITPQKQCIGFTDVSAADWLTPGPCGTRYFPNTLVMEAMAQVGGIPMHTAENPTALMVGLESFEFDGFVHPGDTIRIEARVLWVRGRLFKVAVEACTGSGFQAKGFVLYAGSSLDDLGGKESSKP